VLSAELITCERPDVVGSRVSDDDRTEVDDPAAVRLALERESGVRAIVRKERELWLVGRTRIHLDRVQGLGECVELETVVGRTLEDARAEQERLLAGLGIDESEGIGVSYVDLASGR
jgi:adenylate cyclase class IV